MRKYAASYKSPVTWKIVLLHGVDAGFLAVLDRDRRSLNKEK